MRPQAPRQTVVRPETEPYEFHRARQRVQKKEMKRYLREGVSRHRSCILIPTTQEPKSMSGFHNRLNERKYYKRVAIQGTYVMPTCPLCLEKEKKCKCADEL